MIIHWHSVCFWIALSFDFLDFFKKWKEGSDGPTPFILKGHVIEKSAENDAINRLQRIHSVGLAALVGQDEQW